MALVSLVDLLVNMSRSGNRESTYSNSNCPCNTPPDVTQQIRPFIGSKYFCESGNPEPKHCTQGIHYGMEEGVVLMKPFVVQLQVFHAWFYRDYGNVTTTDYIELRVHVCFV